MSPLPREVSTRTGYLCEAPRSEGNILVRCGVTVVASEALTP